jgi:3-deoxy-D-manno-octulosonate 8-phosphate phosphatase (KDO 8-P phosphatase)
MVSLKRIRLLVFDIDGVLTDGRLYSLPDGQEVKVFNVHDGVGIMLAREAGLKIVFLTGRGGQAVENRAKELKVHKLVTGVKQKEKVLPKVMKEMGCAREETLFMTDEVLDLEAMDLAGVAACPADASPEVLERARIIASRPGGMGAVREVIEKVLKSQGKWLAG